MNTDDNKPCAAADRRQVPFWVRAILIGRRPKWTLIRVVTLVTVIFVVRAYVLLPIWVRGPSMLPTYQDGGVNFVNRLAYVNSPPRRFDVVAIRTSGTSIMYMKRIIAMPGETVAFHAGHAIVNGQPLEEPYLEEGGCDWEIDPVTLREDQYFVVGDNRSMPQGYHYFGRTSREQIVGRILLCKNILAGLSHSER